MLVRIVTWNVWWRFGDDWRERQQGIVATLKSLRPDIVGLQESWAGPDSSQARWLAEQLSMHWAFASPSLPPLPDPPERPDQIGIDLGVALLSRWRLNRTWQHGLPSVHRPEPPVALLATLEHPAGPLHVVVSCVEWEPSFAQDRRAQTRALATLLTDPSLDGPLPALLLADLNAAPDTPPIRELREVMIDTWGERGDDEGVTLSAHNPLAPKETREQIDRRIDYVLARPGRKTSEIEVDQAFVVDTPVDGMFPSDHFPVVVDLGIGSGATAF